MVPNSESTVEIIKDHGAVGIVVGSQAVWMSRKDAWELTTRLVKCLKGRKSDQEWNEYYSKAVFN